MPIKSHFLPESALQGEEVPTFILWKNLEYDFIEVLKTECCELIEVHNVNDKYIEKTNNKILVKKVEVDGYLGLLFKSNRTDNLLVEAEISYNFYKNDRIVESINNKIILFKPQIEIVYVPEKISVIDGKILDGNKIILHNVGEGTCQINFVTSEESDLKISHPKRIKEFIEGFNKTFEEEIDKINKKYRNYDEVFVDLKFLINTLFDPSDEELLNKIKEKTEKLDLIFESDEKFFKDILRAYASSIFKNISLITVMEQFLDYLKSIEKNRVQLLNALNSLSIEEDEKLLEIEIHYTDLLNNKIPSIKLPPIKIISNNKVDLSLFNLFKWDGETKSDL